MKLARADQSRRATVACSSQWKARRLNRDAAFDATRVDGPIVPLPAVAGPGVFPHLRKRTCIRR
jgi:hypothetical protein